MEEQIKYSLHLKEKKRFRYLKFEEYNLLRNLHISNEEKIKASEEQGKYSLYRKETKFKDYTKISFYYQKDNKKEKTCGPVNYNGHRYRLDYETGEMCLYELEEILANKNNSVERTKRLLEKLLDMNDFDWFCTLTFDDKKIKRTDDEAIYSAYVKFIHNIKMQFPALRYITVLERHDDGVIHFHMVIGGVPWQKLGLVNSGKVCCHWATKKNGICSPEYYNRTKHLYEIKDTDGLPVYNITSFIYGYTTATRIASKEKCNSYIKKYISKGLGSSTNIFKKRFYYSANLNVPDEVKKCIGADFETPEDLSLIMKDDPLFQHSERSCYLENYNVLMCRIDNQIKSNIDKGLIPIMEEIKTPFDSEV